MFFRYMINDEDKVGVYISADALTQEKNYFEIEILDSGLRGNIGKDLFNLLYIFTLTFLLFI